MGDLDQSLKFARYILEKRLHDKESKQAELVHLAFETALIVSYSRPFTCSYDFKGKRKSPLLRDAEKNGLTEEELELHKWIITKRDEDAAHSDDRMHLDSKYDYGKSFIGKQITLLPLSKSDTIMLEKMIRKWIDYLKKERTVYLNQKKAKSKELKS